MMCNGLVPVMLLSRTHEILKMFIVKKTQPSNFLHYYKALNENIFSIFHASYIELHLAEY